MSPTELLNNSYWIVLTPFLVGFSIILFFRKSKTLSMLLSVGAVVYGFIHSLLIFHALTLPGTPSGVVFNLPYFSCSQFTLAMGVLIDNMAALMLLVVTSVSLLVQIYTHGYMREDPGYSRFYAYLSLFTGSMLGLVVATNLFQMFFFWELVGVCSYFLIGFWWYKNSAAEACLKAFVMNRIGDCGFLIGIIMLFAATRQYWLGTPVLSFLGSGGGLGLHQVINAAYNAHAVGYWGFTGLFGISMVMLLGPIAKSAQFPLHTWLPDAMEGPTPISALIHAATMVAAGVYLVARAYPIWIAPDDVVHAVGYEPGLLAVACVGCWTAFMAATIAMSQFDIKRALAWSTVSQLGYMFVGLGAGTVTGGIFHLFNHAFFKAMLFLGSGAVIHGLHGEQDMRNMGGLRKSMKGTAITFLIGCLSISGIPPFSGFFSKDDLIASTWSSHALGPFAQFLGGVLILTAGLTSFYMFRAYYLTFEGEYRGKAHPHNSGPAMVYPLIALAVPSVISGWLGFNLGALSDPKLLSGEGTVFANAFGSFVFFEHPHFEGLNIFVMMASLVAAGSGWVVAHMVYYTKAMDINTKIATSKSAFVQKVYLLSFNKWYWDDIYRKVYLACLKLFSVVWSAIDQWIVDNIVNGVALFTSGTGQLLKYTETGQGQFYALVIFGWVALLTLGAYILKP